jgi:hypothetical protein
MNHSIRGEVNESWAPRREDVWESKAIASRILNLGNRWRWVVSFTIRQLYPRAKALGKQWIGSWVGPEVGLDAVGKREIPIPAGNRTPVV